MTRSLPCTAALLAAATLLCACSDTTNSSTPDATADGAAPSNAPSPTRTTTTPPTPTPTKVDALAIRAAKRDLVQADTGTFMSLVKLPGLAISRSGAYSISNLSSDLRVDYALANGPAFSINIITVPDGVYLRFDDLEDDAPPPTCWARTEPGAAASLIATSLPENIAIGIPPEVSTVLLARPSGAGDGARSDLFTIASMLGTTFIDALGIDFDTITTMPIALETDADGLVRWNASMIDLSIAVAGETGREPDALLEVDEDNSQVSSLLTEVGRPQHLEAPPRRRTYAVVGNDARTGAAAAACEAS